MRAGEAQDCVLEAQKRAESTGQTWIASVVEEVEGIDPLAWLHAQEIGFGQAFYYAHPFEKRQFAAVGAVAQIGVHGGERFQEAKAFAKKLNILGPSPRFFAAFSCFEDGESRLILPATEVAEVDGKCTLRRNIAVSPGMNLEDLGEVSLKTEGFGSGSGQAAIARQESREAFKKAVERAKEDIAKGRYEKIVLAREQCLSSAEAFSPVPTLDKLRGKFPKGFTCGYFSGGVVWLAAAPERLVKVEEGVVHTEAVAGSTRRGETVEEDFQLAQALLKSKKDRHEHSIVIEGIREGLESLGLSAEHARVPEMKQLANIQHLHTPIRADLGGSTIDILDIAEKLHPTPAVGGHPKAEALKRIPELEGFKRELYAGAVGYFEEGGAGEFAVLIRCAEVEGNRARLFAGCGIVGDSDPEAELRETDTKLQAILGNLV